MGVVADWRRSWDACIWLCMNERKTLSLTAAFRAEPKQNPAETEPLEEIGLSFRIATPSFSCIANNSGTCIFSYTIALLPTFHPIRPRPSPPPFLSHAFRQPIREDAFSYTCHTLPRLDLYWFQSLRLPKHRPPWPSHLPATSPAYPVHLLQL